MRLCLKTCFLLLLFACSFPHFGNAQEDIDTGKMYAKYEQALSKQLYDEALEALNILGDHMIFKEFKHKETYTLFKNFSPNLSQCTLVNEKARFYINYAEAATYAQDYRGSLDILEDGAAFMERIKDSSLFEYGYVYLKAAENTNKLNLFSESSTYFQKAESLFTHQQDTLMLLWTKSGQSMLFSNYALYDKAKAERAFIFEVGAHKKEYQQVVAIAHLGAASDAFFEDQSQEELAHIEAALQADAATDISEIVSMLTLSYATNIYAEHQDIATSNHYFQLLNDQLADKKDQVPFLNSYYQLSQSKNALVNGQLHQAETYAQQLLQSLHQVDDWQALARVYLLLAEINEQQRQATEALHFYKAYTLLKDSVNQAASRKQFAYVQTQFETEKKDLEILKNNQDITLLQAKNRIVQQRLVFGILLALSIFIVIYIWRMRVYATRKAALQKLYAENLMKHLEQERKRIARELHDGIGQNLLLIKNSFRQQAQTDTLLIEQTIEEVRNMSQSLHPFQFEKLGLLTSIKHTVQNFQRNSKIFYSADFQVTALHISKEKELFIYRMVQECLANVEKHSQAKACRVTARIKDQKITFEIKDNGVGFDVAAQTQTLHSLGLKNLQERAQIVGAELTIHSVKGKGTTICIHLQQHLL